MTKYMRSTRWRRWIAVRVGKYRLEGTLLMGTAVFVGLAAGVVGLKAAEGTLLAGTLGALILWPATLGRGGSLSVRFPGLELPPFVLCALLFAACVVGVVVLALRGTIGGPGRSVERG